MALQLGSFSTAIHSILLGKMVIGIRKEIIQNHRLMTFILKACGK